MPLNLKAVKRRSEPSGTTVIDRHYRFALPRELGWKIGTRVYFTLAKRVTAQGKPRGVVVSKTPGPVWKGRPHSPARPVENQAGGGSGSTGGTEMGGRPNWPQLTRVQERQSGRPVPAVSAFCRGRYQTLGP